MKLLSKKSNSEPLKSLNEREIQERLYGKYHADSSKTTTSSVNTPALPKMEIKNRLEPTFSSQPSTKIGSSNFSAGFLKLLKHFPWKFSSIMFGSLVGAIFALQLLSFWMGTLGKSSRLSHQPTQKIAPNQNQGSVVNIKAPISEIKPKPEPVPPQASAPVLEMKPVPPKPVEEAPKKKYYAVQVCTYFQESEARELTQKLKTLNFHAFYQRGSSNQNINHYLVFLGKEDTYSAAQAKLEGFKKSKEFRSFPDSFIRSV